MEYYDMDEYDYIVRTNISTIVDFDRLKELLNGHSIEYGGGELLNLQWTDSRAGIIDRTWFGTMYISGICIILSRKQVKRMIERRDLIHRNLVDDVAIGVYFQEHVPEIRPYGFDDYFIKVPDTKGDRDRMNEIVMNKRNIFFRNKHMNNRRIDIEQMRYIVERLNRQNM
jgi:hypothetical protein